MKRRRQSGSAAVGEALLWLQRVLHPWVQLLLALVVVACETGALDAGAGAERGSKKLATTERNDKLGKM